MNLKPLSNSSVFLVHSDFPPPDGFLYGFGTREVSGFPAYAAELVRASGGAIKTVVRVRQVHSNRVVYAGTQTSELVSTQADALVSDVEGIAVSISTADCLPLLLFADSPPLVAAVHAGWRGLLGGVIERTLEFIANRWGLMPEWLTAVLGPAISAKHYEVSPELAERFRAAYGPECVTDAEGGPRVSIPAAARRILLNSGLRKSNLYDSDACTYANAQIFHSYRRDKEAAGRQLSFAAITNLKVATAPREEIEL